MLKWDGSAWSVWFDGSAAGLTPINANHNINAFWIPDPSGDDLVLSFAQNRRGVPGITPKVDGMDLVSWDGSAFSFYFDGSDVGLTVLTQEKIDGLHVLPGDGSPIGAGCDGLPAHQHAGAGQGAEPQRRDAQLQRRGRAGLLRHGAGRDDGRVVAHGPGRIEQGMPKNATDSISLSDDGNTLYLTTKGTFNVDSASGGHSMVYAYNMTTTEFSGPTFIAADERAAEEGGWVAGGVTNDELRVTS